MEKNLILAFTLSFLVLFIWYFLFTPTQQQMVPEKKAIHEEQENGTPDKVTLQPSVSPDISPDEFEESAIALIKEEEVAIETPLYSAVFSNKGPTVKSFKLKKYRVNIDPDSPPVEIINLKEDNTDFFSADFYNTRNPEDNKPVYEANKNSINISQGSPPNDLTFEYSRPDGVSISQTFSFYPDRYDIGLTVTVINNSAYQAEGNVRVAINNLPSENKSSYYSFIGTALLLNGEI